jgi:hypothetical protein
MKSMKGFMITALGIVLLVSCQEKDQDPIQDFTPELIVETNPMNLSNRITTMNVAAFSTQNENGTITYNKIAEVAPNTANGASLSATGLASLNQKIYVTYHVRGDVYGGEILTFDVSTANTPQLVHSIIDLTADFNDIMVGQGEVNLWVAGARDIYTSGYDDTDGAIATKIGLQTGDIPSNTVKWEIPLLSYSASSITRVRPPTGQSNGRIFVTSGSKGGLEVIRGNDVNQRFHSRSVDQAKHFDYYDDQGVFLRGIDASSSAIDIYALDDSFAYNSFVIPYDVTPLGKNGIDVTDGYAFLAMGDDGLIKVNTDDGSIAATYHSNGNGDANAVHVDDGYVYLANGSDGLIILKESDLSFVTSYKYNGSCNYVEVKDNLLFVANGSTGGLIILEKVIDNP